MEQYLSIKGLALYFDIAEKTVRKWVLNREIPFCKIKKIIRFRLSEIEQWVSTNGQLPVASDEEIFADDLFDENETNIENACSGEEI